MIDPNKAVTEIENFLLATSQIAQTTLRSVLGKAELDSLLAERERLNIELQQIIDEQTEPWGIKVSTVEVKDVELPTEMQRAIARQAEAERERRAKIIAADGEFQAAEKLSQAADIISKNPATLQLRYLQTLLEMGVNQNTTIVFPLPIDLLKRALSATGERIRASRRATPPRAAIAPEPPEVRIDQLTGLRAILAPGRAERPDAFAPAPAAVAARRRREVPVLRGPRGPHPARGLGRPARRRRAGHAGLGGARGAQPLPGPRRATGRQAAAGPGDGPRQPGRPARGQPPRRRAEPVRLAARARAPTR